MLKHDACIATEHGWVEISDTNKVVNCVTKLYDLNILESNFYKNKECIFWPKINKIENYENKSDKCIAYFETEYIPNIIRYPEFTPKQIYQSLMFLLDVLEYCEANGVYMRTHLWNLTFYNGKPIIIDIRDFENFDNQSWTNIFMGHFSAVLNNHCPVLMSNYIDNTQYIVNQLSTCTNNIQSIRNIINQIKINKTHNQYWSNYHNDRTKFLYDATYFSDDIYNKIKMFKGGCDQVEKSLHLFEIIEEYKPKSVIEIGCNNGLYSFGMTKYANVVGVDYDIKSINDANKINDVLNTNAVFVCLNILNNNEKKYGLNGSYDNIINRVKSEMLIAPAVIHHLYKQCNSTDEIINIFDKYTKRYMLIEHIPNMVDTNMLMISICKYNYKICKQITSCPDPRVWILCEKNN